MCARQRHERRRRGDLEICEDDPGGEHFVGQRRQVSAVDFQTRDANALGEPGQMR